MKTEDLAEAVRQVPDIVGAIEDRRSDKNLSESVSRLAKFRISTFLRKQSKFSEFKKYLKSLSKSNVIPSEIILDDENSQLDIVKAELLNQYFNRLTPNATMRTKSATHFQPLESKGSRPCQQDFSLTAGPF